DAFALVRDAIAALRKERDELVPCIDRRVALRQGSREIVGARIEIARLLEPFDGRRLVARAQVVVGRARVARRRRAVVACGLRALRRCRSRAIPTLRRGEAALRVLPELAALLRFGSLGVGVARARRITQLLAELAEPLE